MALQLAEHQIGFDTTLIGFPSLGGCMGVVLQVPAGLYGFHFTPASVRQAGAFKQWIDNQDAQAIASAVHLYGSCRRGRRYAGTGQSTKWRTEMKEIADMLGYRGKISGYNLSRSRHTPKDTAGGEQAYVEYERKTGSNSCQIRFKRMSKMEPTGRGVKGQDYGLGRVKRDPHSPGDDYILSQPYHSMVVTGIALKTTETKSTSGVMHSASAISSFTYQG